MNLRGKNAFRAITVSLIVCVLQVYVLADATRPIAGANDLVMGRLTFNGNQPVLVNGNGANSGTTILSGTQVQTPEGINATVQLGAAGKLDIAPNSNVTLNFNKSNIDVQVASGNAIASPRDGVKATVTTPDGKTMSSVGQPSANSPAPPAPALSKKRKLGIFFTVVVVVIIIVIVATNGDDSPRRG